MERVINAEELKSNILEAMRLAKKEYIHKSQIAHQIDIAPTVDAVPVVHGRWNKQCRSGIAINGFMVCSVCDVMIPTTDDNHYCLARLDFCPRCGATMDMDGDGNG